MRLEEFVGTMIPSERLVIYDAAGAVLYKGYVGNFYHSGIDTARQVKRHGLGTEIFRKERRAGFVNQFKDLPPKTPVESTSDFPFSDLEMLIFTRVFLED